MHLEGPACHFNIVELHSKGHDLIELHQLRFNVEVRRQPGTLKRYSPLKVLV